MEHLGLLMLRGITDVDDSFSTKILFFSKNESLLGHFDVLCVEVCKCSQQNKFDPVLK